MIKAIIFDVGGVLIRTHHRRGREAWATKLGLDSWAFEDLVFNSESGRADQLGEKSNKSHWAWLQTHFSLSDDELITMRRDFFAGDVMNVALVEHAKRLGQAGYRLGLLSNYGDHARDQWTHDYPFIHHFEGIIISAEVGVMKPDSRIYHLAAESLGIETAEAIFIDDFAKNIEGAKQVGMQGIHFTDPEVVHKALEEMTGVA